LFFFYFTFFLGRAPNFENRANSSKKKKSSPNQNIVLFTLPPNNCNNGEGAGAAVHVGFQILNRERRLGGR